MTALTAATEIEMFVDDGWTDISNYCRAGNTTKFELGHGYRGQAGVLPEPGVCNIKTAVNDGYLWPDNPLSPLFGYLDLNAPLRMAFPIITENFDTTVVNSWPTINGLAPTNTSFGGTISPTQFQVAGGVGTHAVPVASAFRKTTYAVELKDCELSIDFRLPTANVTGGDIEPANLVFRDTAGGYLLLRVTVKPDDTITLRYIIVEAAGGDVASTFEYTTGVVNTGQWLRVKGNVENCRTQAKIYDRTLPEPFVWQADTDMLIGSDDIPEFSPESAYINLKGGVGVRTGVATGNSNTKPVIVEYDNFRMRSIRFHGEVSDYPMVISAGTKDLHTPLRSAGLLQRFTQGDQPAISAIARTVPTLDDIVAYWPLEDASGYFGSGLSGHPPMVPLTGTPGYAQFSGLKASKPLPKGNGSDWIGTVPPYTFADSSQVGMIVDLTTPQIDVTVLFRWYTDHPSAKLWQLVYRTGGDLQLQAWNSESAFVYQSSVIDFNLDGGTHYITVSLQNVGADVTWQIRTLKMEANGETTYSSGTASNVQASAFKRVWVNLSFRTTLAFGHVMIQNGLLDFFVLDELMDAYEREEMSARFARIMTENNIVGSSTLFADAIGTPINANKMGPQKPVSTPELIKQCVELDSGGVIYDARTHTGLMWRRRSSLINQEPVFTISYAGNQITDLFPKRNTRDIRNRITVERIDGGFGVYEKASGAQSSNTPGSGGSGKYETKVSVNALDDVMLQQLAAFRVALLTVDGARYPTLTIDLNNSAVAADSTILSALLDLRPGDFIEMTDAESIFQFDTVRLIVKGYTETITQIEHSFTLICESAEPYIIFEVEHPERGIVDSNSSTLFSAIDDNDMSFVVQSTEELWGEGSGNFPLDIMLRGERVELSDIETPMPAFLAVGAVANADNASVSPAVPTGGGTGAGDDLLLFSWCRDDAKPSNTPAGWTDLGAIGSIRIMRKVHSGAEAAPTVTWTGTIAGDTCSAVMLSFENLGLLWAGSSQGNASAQNVAYQGLNSFIAKGIVIFMARKSDDWTSVPPIPGVTGMTFTELVDTASTLGNDQALSLQVLAFNGLTDGMGGRVAVPGGTMIVTGGGAAVSVTGMLLFGNWQVFTVSQRAKNSVPKEHPAATAVKVFRTGRLAP